MKRIINHVIWTVVAVIVSVSCSDWTEIEQKFPTDLTSNVNKDDYYANLRAYRNTEHEIMFGYYQGFGGASSSYAHSLMGLPDSMDIVSMWGAGFEYNEEQIADLKMAQEKKGLKCLMVFIAHSVGTQISPDFVKNASEETPALIKDRYTGEVGTYTDWQSARRAFWGMDVNDGKNNTPAMEERAIKAVELYADSLCYIINEVLHLDGFDWDFEYGYSVGDNVGDIIGDQGTITKEQAHNRTLAFAKRMREGLGDKIFIIDGVPQSLQAPEACIYFDYFAHQAYGSGRTSLTEANMDSRYKATVSAFSPYMEEEEIAKRTILLETFERSYTYEGKTYYGFGNWTLRDGTKPISTSNNVTTVNDPDYIGGSFEGMARWQPIVNGKYVPKGGIGAYLINNAYNTPGWNSFYGQLRDCIQIMNPAVK